MIKINNGTDEIELEVKQLFWRWSTGWRGLKLMNQAILKIYCDFFDVATIEELEIEWNKRFKLR